MLAYQQLDAWKVSHELALAVYRCTRGAMTENGAAVVEQLRRTAILVPAKLAHSTARRGRARAQYVNLALGYLSELAYHLRLAQQLGVLPQARWRELDALRGRASFYTWKLVGTR